MDGLYAIVDVPHPHGLSPADVCRAAVMGGARTVQLRAKSATTEERIAYLKAMLPYCRAAAALLIANDDVTAALDSGADGVHLGQDDLDAFPNLKGRKLLVGVSTHSIVQFKAALKLRPNYVAFGPVQATKSKAKADPEVGFGLLLEACRLATAPVVAIGGLDAESGARAIGLGAAAVAVIAALVAETPAKISAVARRLTAAFEFAAQPLPFDEVCRRIPVLPTEQLADIARWSDDVGLHVTLGLPARFRPVVDGDTVSYRRSDVLDLTYALGKRPDETWEAWSNRMEHDQAGSNTLVQLRKR
jgi:thiamine-phosphate diphosphorylase